VETVRDWHENVAGKQLVIVVSTLQSLGPSERLRCAGVETLARSGARSAPRNLIVGNRMTRVSCVAYCRGSNSNANRPRAHRCGRIAMHRPQWSWPYCGIPAAGTLPQTFVLAFCTKRGSNAACDSPPAPGIGEHASIARDALRPFRVHTQPSQGEQPPCERICAGVAGPRNQDNLHYGCGLVRRRFVLELYVKHKARGGKLPPSRAWERSAGERSSRILRNSQLSLNRNSDRQDACPNFRANSSYSMVHPKFDW